MVDQIIFALPDLFDGVVTRFAAEGTNVPNLFGWREVPQKIVTGNRIIWVPGDPDGDMGELSIGGSVVTSKTNPRTLFNLGELFHVYLVANDPAAPEDERAQYTALRTLYDAWLRAVYLKATGRFEIQSSKWLVGRTARRFGNAALITATINAPILDVETPVAPIDTGADVDVHELDVTEKLLVPAPSP